MAHFAPPRFGRDHIDRVVHRWRDRCLVEEGSLLFDDRNVWTLENLNHFARSFQAPDPEAKSFLERFGRQFDDDPDDVRWLAAEISVVYCLMVTDMIGPRAKRSLVTTPLGGLDPITAPNWPEVDATFDEGIANPGARFNVRRDLQFLYVAEFAQRLKQLSQADRRALLSDPWRTRDLADEPEGAERLEMRHVVLHLLHSESFERVTSLDHKQKIVAAFAPEVEASNRVLSGPVDEQLLTIRRVLEEAKPDATVDFYSEPWSETWRGTAPEISTSGPGPSGPRWWWVNQGQTYSAERDLGIMWAPLRNKNGLKLAHWERLAEARVGDVVMHYSGALRAVSRVRRAAVNASKPASLSSDAWEMAGRLVETEYVELPQSIQLADIPQAWREAETDGPFSASGAVKQAYFFALSEQFAANLASGFDEIARITGTVEGGGGPVPPDTSLADVYTALSSAVKAAGLLQPPDENRVRNVLAALVAKPFVILSGLSGSGKTQLGLRLGEWFGKTADGDRALVVAVRPEWTGPEALFGYEDLLQSPSSDGRAGWHVPEILAFFLRAAQDVDEPYLLLLDEMNLAHVERYFSDFLSGIESGKPVLPDLALENGTWRRKLGAPAFRELPRNVFVLGTVNVDETTYQFSPKVLDRAFSFEVRTRSTELDPDIAKPSKIVEGEGVLRRTLARLAQDVSWVEGHPHPASATVAAALIRLHEVLSDSEDEFGHRVLFEALRFAAALHAAGESDANQAIDQIVLTKLLPRVHGSRRRVEPVLLRLRRFAFDPERSAADLRAAGDDIDESPALPLSLRKIDRMLARVRVDQFVSFSG